MHATHSAPNPFTRQPAGASMRGESLHQSTIHGSSPEAIVYSTHRPPLSSFVDSLSRSGIVGTVSSIWCLFRQDENCHDEFKTAR